MKASPTVPYKGQGLYFKRLKNNIQLWNPSNKIVQAFIHKKTKALSTIQTWYDISMNLIMCLSQYQRNSLLHSTLGLKQATCMVFEIKPSVPHPPQRTKWIARSQDVYHTNRWTEVQGLRLRFALRLWCVSQTTRPPC